MEKPTGKKARSVALVCSLVLVIATGVLYGFHLANREEKGTASFDQSVVASLEKEYHVHEVRVAKEMLFPPIPPVEIKDSAWTRNPFMPLEKPLSGVVSREKAQNKQPVSTPSLVLSGILKSEGEFLAIINGERRKEGSFVLGWKLVKIENYQVWLRRGGEKLKLELSEKPEEMRIR
ncbi:MAG: hypothetical protein GTO08_09575 [Deltaproteobacteria bacterium]|nr:hypothetical protein [Deltaproteobacteria bacterium]